MAIRPSTIMLLGLTGLAVLAALALSPSAAAFTNVGPVGYPTPTTWTLAGSPYYVNGPVNVIADLTIDAGVQIRFNCACQIAVSGSIHIQGDYANPVSFASNNTVTVPAWVGIQIANPNAASVIANATFDRPQIAIDILQANQGVDISDVRITNASSWGIKARLLHQTSAWTNVTVGDSDSGVNLDDVTLLTFRSFNTYNLTGGGAYSLQGNRVGTSDFSELSFPGGRLQMVDGSTLTFTNVAMSSSVWPTAIEFTRPNTLTATNVQVRGFTGQAILSQAAIAETLITVDVAPLGATQAQVAIAFDTSPGFRVSGATLSNGTAGLSAQDSRDFLADNLTVRRAATGVRITDSPAFVLEYSEIANASEVALSITRSGSDAHIRHVGINSSTLGVRVDGTGTSLALDFASYNYINNVAVLGLYNQPGANVNPANMYSWVYVYGSPNAQVTGANIQSGVGEPSLVWAESSFGRLDQSVVHGTNGGVLIGDSDSLTVSGLLADAPAWGLWFYSSVLPQVLDSAFVTVNGTGAIMDQISDGQFQNVTGRGTVNGLYDFMGVNNRYSNSHFNASTGFRTRLGNMITVEGSDLCSTGVDLQVDATTDAMLLGNTFCAAPATTAVQVTSGMRALVENTTFFGVGAGVDITASVDTYVRWNEFRNCSGTAVRGGSGNGGTRVYENNFFCGALSASDTGGASNQWYNQTRAHGNYWDDYTGIDGNGDFIGDTPYSIAGGARRDLFPLMLPYERVPPTAIVQVTSPIDEDTSSLLNGSSSVDNVAIAGGSWVIHDAGGDVTRQGLVVSYLFTTPGFFRCDFTVSDAWGNIGTGTAYVRVNDKTNPQITSQPGPFAVDEDVTVTLFVAATDNDPGFPGGASFVWQVTGRENVTETTPNAGWQHRFAEPGFYVGNVTVYDGGGNSASASFNVTVRDVTAPTFDFRATGAVPPGQGETVHLTMALASDNDLAFPGPTAFTWIILFPNNSGFIEDYNQSMDFTPPVPGNYTVRYECRDPSGNVQSGQWVFWAVDTEGPQWAGYADFSVAEGNSTSFSAESATDFTGVANATWRDGGVVVSLSLAFDRLWTGLGEHQFTVVLFDTRGNDRTFAFNVTVVDETPPHQLDATWGKPIAVRQEQGIELEAAGQFADNDPRFASTATYAWSIDAPEATWGSPLDATKALLAVSSLGAFKLHLRVSDEAGNYIDVFINITTSDGLAPSQIQWGVSPNMTFVIGTVATFSASAVDPSGVFFRWEFGDGEQAEGPTVSYKYVSTGSWTVTLTVADSLGNEEVIRFTLSVREGTIGGNNNGGNNNGNNTTGTPQGLPIMTIVIIGALVVAAGVAGMAIAFRKRLKRPQAPQTVIVQQEAPRAADPWAKPPPSEYDALYGGSPSQPYDPNERPPGQ